MTLFAAVMLIFGCVLHAQTVYKHVEIKGKTYSVARYPLKGNSFFLGDSVTDWLSNSADGNYCFIDDSSRIRALAVVKDHHFRDTVSHYTRERDLFGVSIYRDTFLQKCYCYGDTTCNLFTCFEYPGTSRELKVLYCYDWGGKITQVIYMQGPTPIKRVNNQYKLKRMHGKIYYCAKSQFSLPEEKEIVYRP